MDEAAADGSPSHDFNLDSARLYFGASLNKNIKEMLNTEWDGDSIRVLDAAGQFAISPALNIWAGRLLSPSDRANMAGPYNSLGGGYWAGVASRYGYNGGIFRSRDDGVPVWGNLLNGVAGRHQKSGVLTLPATGDYSSWNLDFLLEKRLAGADAVSLEAAYYDYDTDNVILSEQGKAYSAGAAYVFDKAIGWGGLQPFVRFQKFSPDSAIDTRQADAGRA